MIMLTATILVACFTVIFSGFSADSLAERLVDADAKLLITADAGLRRGDMIKLKEIADKAVENAPCVEKVIVVKHVGNDVAMNHDRDAFLHDILCNVPHNVYVEPEKVASEEIGRAHV